MKEMRVKGEYIHHKEIKIAMGIKICADNLREAIAGSDMYLVKKDSELQSYMDIFKEEINEIENKINTTSEGVSVAASTLGSLEALLQLLKKSEIPVSNIFIGPVSKEKVVRAMIPLLTQDRKVKKE
jgi:translation initiation factor 5B